jgi:hypothetical protein
VCSDGGEGAWRSGYHQGKKDQQEHIIKLLEEASKPKCDSEACNCWDIQGLEEAIALIKGENKATSWTNRPLTEEDIESYGIEGEK